MGRKIIPLNLRLQYKKNWKSQWMESTNYSKLLNVDLCIREYLSLYLQKKSINLVDISIQKNFNNLLVYIYFCGNTVPNKDNDDSQLDINNVIIEKTIDQFLRKSQVNVITGQTKVFMVNVTPRLLNKSHKIKNINKTFRSFWLPVDFKRKIVLFNMLILTKNPKILADIISENIERNPQHKRTLFVIKKLFDKLFINYYNFKGYKIEIKGRVNKSKRSRKLKIQNGQISLNTITQDISYGFSKAITPMGSCSVKVWFSFK